jgi:PIN domain nuclease of toxin-antitoxin system
MIAKGVAADTHAIIWYIDSPTVLSPRAAAAMDSAADDARNEFSSPRLVLLKSII